MTGWAGAYAGRAWDHQIERTAVNAYALTGDESGKRRSQVNAKGARLLPAFPQSRRRQVPNDAHARAAAAPPASASREARYLPLVRPVANGDTPSSASSRPR